MITGSIYRTIRRYRTLQTDRITSLPIVILMPHSACNCRCVMCDIWKDNHNLKQLTAGDITHLLGALKKFDTQQVVMSGGEALLNRNFFTFCEILKQQNIRISLLSTGLTLKRHAAQIVQWVDDVIVSLDGDEPLHDAIRNIPGAFNKIRDGIAALRSLKHDYKVTGRTVIHRLNFHNWPKIIDSARSIGLNSISFLPADVSSAAFNREQPWDEARRHEILLSTDQLREMKMILDDLVIDYAAELESRFIAESPEKLTDIYAYYAASNGLGRFPFKKCNAPWVSAVIEADGSVRPCFFHSAYGNIRSDSLQNILNSDEAVKFRRTLDMSANETCVKCVCHLNLSPSKNLF